jgi:hypothetical protein
VIEVIDEFFVLDFDRCLSDFDANINLLTKVVSRLSTIDSKTIQMAHDETRARGLSFRLFEYIKENDPDVDLDIIFNAYIKHAHSSPGSLLKSGARELLDFLTISNYSHCIMTYGDPLWQTTKIIAAGFEDVRRMIVPSEYKSRYIASWFDSEDGFFAIPEVCFPDNKPRKTREVILVDDKTSAFEGLPDKARGYLVKDTSNAALLQQGAIPPSVRRVSCLNEIIYCES